jgi:thioredoxin-related protein
MFRRVRSMLIAAACAVCVAVLSAPSAHAAPVVWKDWNAGFKEAAASNRPVLVDVYTDWCGWCKRMDKDVYTNAEIRSYLADHFVMVRMNAESDASARWDGQDYSMRSLASRFRVSGYPTTIFFRSGGDHLANVPGYVPADRFMVLLHYIGEGQMDRGVSFDDYVKQQAGQQ